MSAYKYNSDKECLAILLMNNINIEEEDMCVSIDDNMIWVKFNLKISKNGHCKANMIEYYIESDYFDAIQLDKLAYDVVKQIRNANLN